MSMNALTRLKKFLMRHFNEIIVLGYVRPPRSYMASKIQQDIKVGTNSCNNIQINFGSYRGKFEKFDSIFGKDNVCLVKYDSRSFPNGDVVTDFCKRLGMNVPNKILSNNKSISKEAVKLLYAYRKFGPGFGTGDKAVKENNQILEIISKFGSTKFEISSELIEPFLIERKADIEWIEKRLRASMSEDNYDTVDAIRSENDLLHFDADIVKALQILLKEQNISSSLTQKTYSPQEIANLVHALREQLSKRGEFMKDIAAKRPNQNTPLKPRPPKGGFSSEKKAYIQKRIKELSPWYHKIDLGDGIVTPGRNYDRLWNGIRNVMDYVDYTGKRVIDIASWDGMWAFEAELRGASRVVSTDVRLNGYSNLLFVREILESNVIPMCNVPVQDLCNRLKVVNLDNEFDIVHHLGVFYHLRDPLLSLSQARAVMPEGGLLVLETAFVDDDKNSFMAFAGLPGNFHFYGVSDTWAPTRRCLKEVLIRTQFRPIHEDTWQIVKPSETPKAKSTLRVDRITMLAEAVGESSVHQVELRKIKGIQ